MIVVEEALLLKNVPATQVMKTEIRCVLFGSLGVWRAVETKYVVQPYAFLRFRKLGKGMPQRSNRANKKWTSLCVLRLGRRRFPD